MNGLITVISGPMFAGKTKKLIDYYHNLKKTDKKIVSKSKSKEQELKKAYQDFAKNEKLKKGISNLRWSHGRRSKVK